MLSVVAALKFQRNVVSCRFGVAATVSKPDVMARTQLEVKTKKEAGCRQVRCGGERA